MHVDVESCAGVGLCRGADSSLSFQEDRRRTTCESLKVHQGIVH